MSNPQYAKFYQKKAAELGQYVILDNDAYEGSAVSIERTFLAIDIIQPQEVVLRDVLDNCLDTIISSFQAKEAIVARYGARPPFQIMAIPQGNNFGEWLYCLSQVYNLGDCIGVPRRQADRMNTWLPHVRAIKSLWYERGHKPIHLFGAPHKWQCAAEVEKTFPSSVRGTDTAKPIHYAISEMPLDPDVDVPAMPRRPINFFTYELSPPQLALAQYNINRFKDMVK
jgi:hypothetical protein